MTALQQANLVSICFYGNIKDFFLQHHIADQFEAAKMKVNGQNSQAKESPVFKHQRHLKREQRLICNQERYVNKLFFSNSAIIRNYYLQFLDKSILITEISNFPRNHIIIILVNPGVQAFLHANLFNNVFYNSMLLFWKS